MHDTKTPLKISLFAISVNALLAILLVRVWGFGVWSLGLSYAIGSLVDAGLLFFYLIKRLGNINMQDFLRAVNKISIASIMMGIALYIPYRALDVLIFDTTRTLGLIFLTATVGSIGLITYLFCAWILRIDEYSLVVDAIGKRSLLKDFLKVRGPK